MGVIRTNLADGIVCDILLPKKQSTKLAVIAPGMPSNSSKHTLLKQLTKRGYVAVHLRYRGTWESSGVFLDHDPTKDVLDVIQSAQEGFSDVWTGKEYAIQSKKTIVFGSSFGGAAAILSTQSNLVDKAIAISPVVDWTSPSESEPMDWLERVVQNGYPGAYRFSHSDWTRLSKGEFYQPVKSEHKIDSSKLTIFHAMDDTVVPAEPVRAFAQRINCDHHFFNKGGHQLGRKLTTWWYRNHLTKLL